MYQNIFETLADDYGYEPDEVLAIALEFGLTENPIGLEEKFQEIQIENNILYDLNDF